MSNLQKLAVLHFFFFFKQKHVTLIVCCCCVKNMSSYCDETLTDYLYKYHVMETDWVNGKRETDWVNFLKIFG